MKKLLATFTLIFLLIALKAQEISTEGFSPATIRPNATATYTIKVENVGGTADLNGISAKIPEGLKFLGENQSRYNRTSNINGVSENKSGINLTLSFSASKEGTYTIDAWVAKVGNKEYPVPAHTLTVDANAPIMHTTQAQSAFSSDPFDMMNQMMGRRSSSSQPETLDLSNLLSAKLVLPKEKIFIGESIPCEIVLEVDRQLMTRAGFAAPRIFPHPKDTDAFTCKDLGREANIDSSNPARIIYKYDTVITPNKVGTYSLSYAIEGIFQNRSFFGSPYQFNETAKLDNIEIESLPTENRPASFSGGIGEFTLASSDIDPTSASVGELLTLSFTISGVGNFDRISAPKLYSSEDWKVYEPTSEFKSKSDNSFAGEKTFIYRIVPQKADLEYVPSLSFSFFNPLKEEYFSIEIPQPKLSISPAARMNSIAPISIPTQEGVFDIITDSNEAQDSAVSLFARADFWIYQAIIIICLGLFISYKRHILMLESNPAKAKNIKERRAAKIHLKYAKKYAFEHNSKMFFESAIRAIQFSLSRTEDVQAVSITLKDAKRLLKKRNLDSLGIDVFFDSLDSMNYALSKTAELDLMQLEKSLREICKKLLR